MKKILILLGALSVSSILDAYDERIQNFYQFYSSKRVNSKTFMFTRPVYYHLMMRKHLWHQFVHKPGCNGVAAQAIGFYQDSIPQDRTAEYFLPCGNTCLLVSGDNHTDELCERNVRAEWLYLSSDFQGVMSIKPKQRQAGASLELFADLGKFSSWKLLEGTWVAAELPVMWVENDINLSQRIIEPAPQNPELPQDICQAFNQPAWCFAKMNGKMKETKLAEVRLVLGRNYLSCNHYEIDYYTSAIFPTGNKQCPQYTFSPVVGNNKHWGFGGGTDFQILLNRDTSKFFATFFFDFEVLALFHNMQHRTFDLKNKPWSRYLLFVDKCRPGITVPGPNVLTLKCAITPYLYADFSIGWRLQKDCFEFEFGYNVWGHGNEKLTLHEGFDRCWGIAGVGVIEDICDGIVPATASCSTISCQTPNDECFVAIRETDLQLQSAEAHSSLNHTIHFAFGCTQDYESYGYFGGLGIYAEWPEKNSALQAWGTWAKLGATF